MTGNSQIHDRKAGDYSLELCMFCLNWDSFNCSFTRFIPGHEMAECQGLPKEKQGEVNVLNYLQVLHEYLLVCVSVIV